MSNDNLNWEVATKDNLSGKITRNPQILERNKNEVGKTYGLGSIAIAVLFVGVVIFIEKRSVPQALNMESKNIATKISAKENQVLTNLSKKLADVLKNNNFYRSINIVNNQIVIELSSDELFNKASDDTINLSGTAATVLTQIANESLQANNLFNIQVASHTDIRNISDKVTKHYNSNWELTAMMSAKIINIFELVGFAQKSLLGKGIGSGSPLFPSRDIKGHLIDNNLKANRRIEILIF